MNKKTQPDFIIEIAYKRLNGTATPQEIAIYDKWYASFDDSEIELENTNIAQQDLLGAQLYAKLMTKIDRENRKPSWLKLNVRWVASAAAVLLVTLGYLAYNLGWSDAIMGNYAAKHQPIVPGKRTATLKLANGKVIQLKENEEGIVIDAESLTYTDGTDIALSKNQISTAEAMVLSTPKGGTYQVVLPDGSKVWLNALSSLTLPSNFANSVDRHVQLKGEAYFEIAKSETVVDGKKKRRPFIVAVGDKTVEVLGTHFNVKYYEDEPGVKTTLLEGSVKMVAGKQQKVIVPGQQAFATDQNIATANVDIEEVVAWKNGNFQFADEKIQTIMQEIGRWYNVEVVYQSPITKESFGGTISRNKPITEVLASLEETGAVHFKIEGRRVIVMP
ncbi:FecR family protein [Pedobacter sp.]